MPLVSKVVNINGENYLDGAIECNIPIKWALDEDFEKIVVVLTRDENYKKKPVSKKLQKVYSIVYKKYPELIKTMCNRPQKYNDLTKNIKELEKQGRILVLRPSNPINVSRLERDKEKLKNLYEIGRKEAKDSIKQIIDYINF